MQKVPISLLYPNRYIKIEGQILSAIVIFMYPKETNFRGD